MPSSPHSTNLGCGVGCRWIHHIEVSSRHSHRRSKRHLGLVYGSQLYSSHLLVERRQRHRQVGNRLHLMPNICEQAAPWRVILLLPRSRVKEQDRPRLHNARPSVVLLAFKSHPPPLVRPYAMFIDHSFSKLRVWVLAGGRLGADSQEMGFISKDTPYFTSRVSEESRTYSEMSDVIASYLKGNGVLHLCSFRWCDCAASLRVEGRGL